MFNIENCDDILVGAKEICDAISKLDNNKTRGTDNIYAEHLKYANSRVLSMLAMCFAGF